MAELNEQIAADARRASSSRIGQYVTPCIGWMRQHPAMVRQVGHRNRPLLDEYWFDSLRRLVRPPHGCCRLVMDLIAKFPPNLGSRPVRGAHSCPEPVAVDAVCVGPVSDWRHRPWRSKARWVADLVAEIFGPCRLRLGCIVNEPGLPISRKSGSARVRRRIDIADRAERRQLLDRGLVPAALRSSPSTRHGIVCPRCIGSSPAWSKTGCRHRCRSLAARWSRGVLMQCSTRAK